MINYKGSQFPELGRLTRDISPLTGGYSLKTGLFDAPRPPDSTWAREGVTAQFLAALPAGA